MAELLEAAEKVQVGDILDIFSSAAKGKAFTSGRVMEVERSGPKAGDSSIAAAVSIRVRIKYRRMLLDGQLEGYLCLAKFGHVQLSIFGYVVSHTTNPHLQV